MSLIPEAIAAAASLAVRGGEYLFDVAERREALTDAASMARAKFYRAWTQKLTEVQREMARQRAAIRAIEDEVYGVGGEGTDA